MAKVLKESDLRQQEIRLECLHLAEVAVGSNVQNRFDEVMRTAASFYAFVAGEDDSESGTSAEDGFTPDEWMRRLKESGALSRRATL